MDSPSDMIDALTRTERYILQCLMSSMTEYRIAKHIQRSPHTVHTHVKNIYRKLDIHSRREIRDVFGTALEKDN